MTLFQFLSVLSVTISQILCQRPNQSSWSSVLPRELLGGVRGNPGLKTRITEQGLKYVEQLSIRVLNNQLSQLRIPVVERDILNGRGHVRISNVRTVDYTPPRDFYLSVGPPDALQWNMVNFKMRTVADFDGTYKVVNLLPPVQASGQATASVSNIKYQLTLQFGRSPDGYPTLSAVGCTASIGGMDVEFDSPRRIVGMALNYFKESIAQALRPMMANEMCRLTRQIVNNDANNILRTMPTRIPLKATSAGPIDLLGAGGGNRRQSNRFQQPFQKHKRSKRQVDLFNLIQGSDQMILDYGLIRAPLVHNHGLTLHHAGEISWRGSGRTPFYPMTMPDGSFTENRMLYIYASDYMCNSMFFHAFQQKLMDIEINPLNTKPWAPLLRTKCDETSSKTGFDFCVGDLFPQLADSYPNRNIGLRFTASKPPALVFTPTRATIHVQGILNMAVLEPEKKTKFKVLGASMDLVADTHLAFSRGSQKISGNVTVPNMKLTLLETRMTDFGQADLDELAVFSSEILAVLMTELLQQGLPIPSIRGLRMHNPEITLGDRFARIKSDFTIDERYFFSMVGNAVNSRLNSIG